MLPIEYKIVGFLDGILRTFKRTILQFEVASAFKLHEGAHGITLCQACNDIDNTIVVPCPVALEFGELQLSSVNLTK